MGRFIENYIGKNFDLCTLGHLMQAQERVDSHLERSIQVEECFNTQDKNYSFH